MPPVESDVETARKEHLAEQPVSAYLGDDERIRAQLSNTRVGVERVDDGGTRRIEPGADCGAVAVLTDRRALFLVGDPDGDEATSVPYVEFTRVETRTETLTRTLVVETLAGTTWEFTVREVAALDDAISHLESDVPERLLNRAERHLETVEDATGADDREQRIRALEAAVDAFRRATTVVDEPDVDTTAARAAAESAVTTLIETRLARARDCRSVGNWSAETGDLDEALDRYEAAGDCFERALELAERYPPGDADAIATEREDVLQKRDAVEATVSASSAVD